jgi:hypothetical protein
MAAGHVTARMIEASFHVFRRNSERSQSCCQRAAKVVRGRSIFKPGCSSFGVFWLKILRLAFVLWADSNRERMAIYRLGASSPEMPGGTEQQPPCALALLTPRRGPNARSAEAKFFRWLPAAEIV